MQRQCHICGYVESNDNAIYCTECGQKFLISSKYKSFNSFWKEDIIKVQDRVSLKKRKRE